MPKYRVTAPDGRVFEVTAPKETTKAQVLAFVHEKAQATPVKKDEPNMAESAVAGAAQGGSLGFGDELMAALMAPVEYAGSRMVDAPGLSDKSMPDIYRKERDKIRSGNTAAEEANPLAYHGSELAAGLALPVPGAGAKAGGALIKKGAGAAVKEGAKLGAKIGAAGGAGYSDETDIGGLVHDTLVGAGFGATMGGVLPLAAGGAKKGGKLVAHGADRVMAAMGNNSAARRIFLRKLASDLTKEGYQPDQVKDLVVKAEYYIKGQTLSEATKSGAAFQTEKNIASGTDVAGKTFREGIDTRNKSLLTDKATDLKKGFETAKPYYKAAEDEFVASQALEDAAKMPEPLPGKEPPANPYFVDGSDAAAAPNPADHNTGTFEALAPADVQTTGRVAGRSGKLSPLEESFGGILDEVNGRLAQLQGIKGGDAEKAALTAARDRLTNLQTNGLTYKGIQEAKQQLRSLFIEGADEATQRRANKVSGNVASRLDSLLTERSPVMQKEGDSRFMQGLAGKDMETAVSEARKGNISQAYEAIAGSPEKQEEFLRKLYDPETEVGKPELRSYYENVINSLENISQGWGRGTKMSQTKGGGLGKTEETTVGARSGAFDIFNIPQNLARKFGQTVQPAVYKEGADITMNPLKNIDEITGAMAKTGKSDIYNPDTGNSGVKRAATGAVDALQGTFVPSDKPAVEGPLKLTITPQDNLPAVDLPQVGPQSMVNPKLKKPMNIADLFASMIG